MPFDLESPVTRRQLRRLDDRSQCVQFSSALTERDYRRLGEWIAERPAITLRAYGSYDGSITDLDFLRWFPRLRRFQVDVHSLRNLDGLRHLPEDLEVLVLGATRTRLSLHVLERFLSLRRLSIEGHTKDIGVLSRLQRVADLTLRSVTLPDLGLLTPLDELTALDIKLGGTTDLGLLPQIGRIRYLEVWQVRGLADLAPVADLPGLEYLFLQSLRRVEELPDLSRAASLKRIWLETMKGLTDFESLKTAPALQHVALIDMPHLQPEATLPLRDCASLRSARCGLGSDRKNNRVRDLLGGLTKGDWDVWDRRDLRYR